MGIVQSGMLCGMLAVLCPLAVTAVLAIVHLTTRTPDKKGEILVNGTAVKIGDLELEPVVGTTVNGKGEEKQIDAMGIPLGKLFGEDFESVTVTASDEYSAVIKRGELDGAYLIGDEEEGMTLIVFGDPDSKRSVKHVARIVTE